MIDVAVQYQLTPSTGTPLVITLNSNGTIVVEYQDSNNNTLEPYGYGTSNRNGDELF